MKAIRTHVSAVTLALVTSAHLMLLSGLCLAAEGHPTAGEAHPPACAANPPGAHWQINQEGLDCPRRDDGAVEPSYLEGQVIVKVKDNAYLNTIHKTPQTRSVEPVFKHLLRLPDGARRPPGSPPVLKARTIQASAFQRGLHRIHLVHLSPGVSVERVLATYKDDPNVELVQPNYIYQPDLVPNDPLYDQQYSHQLTQAEQAWDMETGAAEVTIAVIGSGVDIDHPDLAANVWTNSGEVPDNGVDDDGNGYVDDVYGWNFDDGTHDPRPESSSHETRVAGVIAAAGNNGEGVCGVTWHAAIMPLRAAYVSTQIAAAVEYARENGAQIINMSFGNYTKSKYGDGVVKDVLEAAHQENLLLVATAGNDKVDTKRYPAALPIVIATAATDRHDARSIWGTGYTGTNYGPWVDLAAPGSDILTTDYPGGLYASPDGTSYAAPYVSGLGALLLSRDPALTNVEVRAILEHTADAIDEEPAYIYIGTGRVNAHEALLAPATACPLGEIVAPENKDRLTETVPQIAVQLFARGDHYQLEYKPYDRDDWILLAEGVPDADVQGDGLIHVSWGNPGIGTFIVRLTVTTAAETHVDTKMIGVEGGYQEHWPSPELGYRRYITSTAICMDIDEDGRNEIIQSSYGYGVTAGYTYIWNEDGTSLPAWPQGMSGDPSCSTSAVGDVDGDGDYEVVTTTYAGGHVYVWNWQDGGLLPGSWPRTFSKHIRGGPLLVDLDADGDSEIVVPVAGYDETYGVHALQGDGTTMWTFPMENVQAPMAAADLDGDGDIEIAVSAWKNVYVLDHNGGEVARWDGGSHKPVVIADLDGDGGLEIICVDGDRSTVRAVRLGAGPLWEVGVGDAIGGYGSVSVGDLDGEGHPEVFMANHTGPNINDKIYAWDHAGNPLTALGFPKDSLGKLMQTAPTVADIDGDGQKEVLVGSGSEMLFAWDRNGGAVDTFPRLTAGDISATATLADLDQDGDVEVMLGALDYRFYVWDLPGAYDPDDIDWGMYRHDAQCSGLALRAPRLSPIETPSTLRVGETLQLELHALNPAGLPLRFYVRQMPAGSSFDDQTGIFTWTPTPGQVGGPHHFYLFVTDGIRQDHRPVSVTVVASGDCNGNGIPDACDIECGPPGGECDVPGCGQSADSNGDGIPDECPACQEHHDCDDNSVCTWDQCTDHACVNTPRLYGDTNDNGIPNVFDIFCILDLIEGDPVGPECDEVNADIAGMQGECEPNGVLNVFDMFAVLDAIAGVDPCCSPQLTGACCTEGICTDGITHANCYYGDGVYMGDGTDCGSVTCP